MVKSSLIIKWTLYSFSQVESLDDVVAVSDIGKGSITATIFGMAVMLWGPNHVLVLQQIPFILGIFQGCE